MRQAWGKKNRPPAERDNANKANNANNANNAKAASRAGSGLRMCVRLILRSCLNESREGRLIIARRFIAGNKLKNNVGVPEGRLNL
jgi:hypothetical protein